MGFGASLESIPIFKTDSVSKHLLCALYVLSTGGEWDTRQTIRLELQTQNRQASSNSEMGSQDTPNFKNLSWCRTAQRPGEASSLTLEVNRTEITSKFHPFTGCVTLNYSVMFSKPDSLSEKGT